MIGAVAVLSAAGCLPAEELPLIEVAVYSGGEPVEGAAVTVIVRAIPDGAPSDLKGLEGLRAGPVVTDATGVAVVPVRGAGVIEILAEGGRATELGAAIVAPGGPRLRALVTFPPVRSSLVVSPWTTLAAALAEARVDQAGKEQTIYHAVARANELLSTHLSVDIATTRPAPLVGEVQLTPEVMYSLEMVGLAAMAQANGRALGWVSSLDVLAALIADVQEPDALLDGVGESGVVVIPGCSIDGCAAQGDMTPEACAAICQLDHNTLRSRLASAILLQYLPSPDNLTGLEFSSVASLGEALQTNTEVELFGDGPVGALSGEPPVLAIEPTSISPEIDDRIEFYRDTAYPRFETHGPEVELGPSGCPMVTKYSMRMDDPSDNPLRWVFAAVSKSGAPIRADAGRYRVRNLDSGQWLTDWQRARAIELPDVVRFEAVLLRDDIPELATKAGHLEIGFKVHDRAGLSAEARSCWSHIPLAAPLRLIDVVEPLGVRSLAHLSLHPGNNMAPALRQLSTADGRAIMEAEILNGSGEPVFVTLSFDQPATTYGKTWRHDVVLLCELASHDPGCIASGACRPPPSARIARATETGTLDSVVGDVRVTDMSTGAPVPPCDPAQAGCDPYEFLLAPGPLPGAPRRYRLELVITDLSMLTPMWSDEDVPVLEETVLDPVYAPDIAVTGFRTARFQICGALASDGSCAKAYLARELRALAGVELHSHMELRVFVTSSPALDGPPGPAVPFPGAPASLVLPPLDWGREEGLMPDPEAVPVVPCL